jgi:hypothetical protein
MSDGVITLTVSDGVTSIYSGSAHWATVVMWVALPPIALWLIWMLGVARGRGVLPSAGTPELGEGAMPTATRQKKEQQPAP